MRGMLTGLTPSLRFTIPRIFDTKSVPTTSSPLDQGRFFRFWRHDGRLCRVRYSFEIAGENMRSKPEWIEYIELYGTHKLVSRLWEIPFFKNNRIARMIYRRIKSGKKIKNTSFLISRESTRMILLEIARGVYQFMNRYQNWRGEKCEVVVTEVTYGRIEVTLSRLEVKYLRGSVM
jgi:hypothetical protein